MSQLRRDERMLVSRTAHVSDAVRHVRGVGLEGRGIGGV